MLLTYPKMAFLRQLEATPADGNERRFPLYVQPFLAEFLRPTYSDMERLFACTSDDKRRSLR